MTIAIEAAGKSAQAAPRSRRSASGNRAAGSATSVACAVIRTASEIQNGSVTRSVRGDRDCHRLASRRVDARDAVSVALVERLALEQRPRERLEPRTLALEQGQDLLLTRVDDAARLLVDQLLRDR